MKNIIFLIFLLTAVCGCENSNSETEVNRPEGKLYIIGGGKRPAAMVAEMISLAQLNTNGHYAIVLPMASEEPDTSFFYFAKPFRGQGLDKIYNFFSLDVTSFSPERLDSVRNANLIFITGGDQNRFMQIVQNTPLHTAIIEAYQKGAVIGGTSAGAAVQSKKMITGNELKYPEYTGQYRTIEAENIEIAQGLGLLETAIVDQHFIWRMRMNRLIAAAIENPDELLIGIDESTAIIVEGDSATVTGQSQVVVLHNKMGIKHIENGLLGSAEMVMGVYLPGQRFSLIP
jgi:cyanophycinase